MYRNFCKMKMLEKIPFSVLTNCAVLPSCTAPEDCKNRQNKQSRAGRERLHGTGFCGDTARYGSTLSSASPVRYRAVHYFLSRFSSSSTFAFVA